MDGKIYDLCVIGGGINGAGIVRDAAGRGLSVALVEARDLAAATSSSSTKLIHGGLRYLEYFEFALVRSALQERETLLSIAPHIIRPMEFILPHDGSMRPRWVIQAGLFLYDHLAGHHNIPGSRGLNLKGYGLKNQYSSGFSYYDCWADDARLVVLNAMDAAAKGADIFTYTKCTKLEEDEQSWVVHLQDKKIRAKKIINASGPWAKEFLKDNKLDEKSIPDMRLVKGSHIIVKRRYEGAHAFLLQQPDGRIVFVIPYENNFTLIGTTEENYTGDPYEAALSEDEKNYLMEAYNRAFENPVSEKDITWHYSGVRPLLEDGSKDTKSVTRDYRLHLHENTQNPMVSVLGGKLTTYRILSEKAVNMILRQHKSWTGEVPLPGGDIENFHEFLAAQTQKYPDMPEALLHRLAKSYGTRMEDIAKNLGEHYGDNIYQSEIDYLIQHEFAKTLDDILWRRSKLGLHISEKTRQNLEKRFS